MIRLNNEYGIEVGDCFILYRIKVSNGEKRKGEEYLIPTGYFTNLAGALDAFRKEVIKEDLRGRDIDLSEALASLHASNARVEQMITDATGGD